MVTTETVDFVRDIAGTVHGVLYDARECLESPTNTDSRQPTKFEGVAKR